MSDLKIPVRTSSKRKQGYEAEIEHLDSQMNRKRKGLVLKGSFNTTFWKSASELAGLSASKVELRRKKSRLDFTENGGDERDWASSDESRAMQIEAFAMEKQRDLFSQQAKRLDAHPTDLESSLRRSFMRFFTTSKLGLGILGSSAGKRNSRLQSDFRKKVIAYYGSSNGQTIEELWCPIVGADLPSVFTCAAHIFGYMNGQETMTAIFGETDEPELWSPRNGMLVSSQAEAAFNKGFLAIVPNVSDQASLAEISLWSNSEPKEYKLKIIDPTHPYAKEGIFRGKGERKLTWLDLDNRKVLFQNANRPRARYLYYHYCIQVLRRAWNMQMQGDVLKDELKKHFWGTPGRYIRYNMLRAFVEELGHEYEQLLEAAMEDLDDATNHQSDPTLLGAAINQIERSVAPEEDEEDEEDDDDDDGLQANLGLHSL